LNIVPKELIALTFFTVNLLDKYLLNTPGLLIADFITVGKELRCNILSDLDTSIIKDGGTMARLEIFDLMTSFIIVVCVRGASMGC
jgi:hypothetical protein